MVWLGESHFLLRPVSVLAVYLSLGPLGLGDVTIQEMTSMQPWTALISLVVILPYLVQFYDFILLDHPVQVHRTTIAVGVWIVLRLEKWTRALGAPSTSIRVTTGAGYGAQSLSTTEAWSHGVTMDNYPIAFWYCKNQSNNQYLLHFEVVAAATLKLHEWQNSQRLSNDFAMYTFCP